MASKPKPTLVFVTGGWHSPDCFDAVREPLEKAGYSVHTPEMPSVASAKTKTHLDDGLLVNGIVEKCADAGEDVIVIGHSSGGFIACEGCKGVTKAGRAAQGKKGGVVAIGMIAAFIPPMQGEGTGAFEKVPPMDVSWWVFDEEGTTFRPDGPPGPARLFYSDLPQAEADYWVSKLRPMHAPLLGHEWYEAWRDVPLFYLICENDVGQPLVCQEAMIAAAREEGGTVTETRVPSGHSPFLSMPMEVVKWLRGVAGEEGL